MIAFPNCKINLGLNITSKREDGYHNLETVFAPVSLKDILEVIHADNSNNPIQYSSSGIPIDNELSNNLCAKAYHLLKKDFQDIPAIQLHLHKTIPTGAGLGGGSADGAFMLKMLNTKFNLGLSPEQLIQYALQLGSDCPFFIYNKPCFASGRGEIMEPVELNLSGYKILLVNPGIHVNTGQAFSQLTPAIPKISIKEIVKQPINNWKVLLKNDFEESVFKQHPEIKEIKESLYKSGAVYSSMSGSGSTVYGIFEKSAVVNVSFPQHYFVKESSLIHS
ncbi:MAG: 4-(cytidine 5'-diphospho)-2-C-methyl-D-erythritol kinase [Bacteroidetes bacterium]|nr:4-(cytidine 5'-diphospho)-2-C-methyl-D-erythritol kinase [Bacteroidota bacterium]